MKDRDLRPDSAAEEFEEFERQLDAARRLSSKLRDSICEARQRDRQVLIERRRKPR
jgi:hypothetical protein